MNKTRISVRSSQQAQQVLLRLTMKIFKVPVESIGWTELIFFGRSLSSFLAFVDICLIIISEWPPLSHRLLWFW